MPISISFSIPDNIKDRVIDAMCATHGYSSTVKDAQGATIPNPVTKGQFCKTLLIDHVKQIVTAYEKTTAEKNAGSLAVQKADAEIILS